MQLDIEKALVATLHYKGDEVLLTNPLEVLQFANRVVSDVLTSPNRSEASAEAQPLLHILGQIAEAMTTGETPDFSNGACACGNCGPEEEEDETWGAAVSQDDDVVAGGIVFSEIGAVLPEDEGELLLPYCIRTETPEGIRFLLPFTICGEFTKQEWNEYLPSTWSLIGRIIPLFHDAAVAGSEYDIFISIDPATVDGPDGNIYYKITFKLSPSEA